MTLEDLLEELVGDILDESDRDRVPWSQPAPNPTPGAPRTPTRSERGSMRTDDMVAPLTAFIDDVLGGPGHEVAVAGPALRRCLA